MLGKLAAQINNVQNYKVIGSVTSIQRLLIKCVGITNFVSIGSQCRLYTRVGKEIIAEVIAVDHEITSLMPFEYLSDVWVGCKVELIAKSNVIYPDDSWLGRVLNSRAIPLDGKGMLLIGDTNYNLHAPPPAAYEGKLLNICWFRCRKIHTSFDDIKIFSS